MGPMIIYACSDLFFATRIRSTADSLGVVTRPVRDGEALQRRLDQVDDGKANDPVRAVMVDLELGEAAVSLIRQAKQHTASPTVIAFGSHVAKDVLQTARTAGADQVLPRSAFTVELPGLLEAYGNREVRGRRSDSSLHVHVEWSFGSCSSNRSTSLASCSPASRTRRARRHTARQSFG